MTPGLLQTHLFFPETFQEACASDQCEMPFCLSNPGYRSSAIEAQQSDGTEILTECFLFKFTLSCLLWGIDCQGLLLLPHIRSSCINESEEKSQNNLRSIWSAALYVVDIKSLFCQEWCLSFFTHLFETHKLFDSVKCLTFNFKLSPSLLAQLIKNLPASAGDVRRGLDPSVGKTPWKRKWLLQCSCLGNPTNRGAWWATVHGVAESWTRLRNWPCPHRLWLRTWPVALEKELKVLDFA